MPEPLSQQTSPVFQVERGCPVTAQGGACACLGICHELIDVVKAEDYWKVVGQHIEAHSTALLWRAAEAAYYQQTLFAIAAGDNNPQQTAREALRQWRSA